ncbi:hypothetical protein MKEN_01119700 [Mycena kentingensis (nom. inval.)]|nr:hypothetical protein MKEN_01119700 [Mycena kentingensis (nom. inval.)]
MSSLVPTDDAAPPIPSFAQIFGPVFWGFCVSLLLSGVSALQGYLYFTAGYKDKLGLRLLAMAMLFVLSAVFTFPAPIMSSLLDFISTALICQSMYYYMLLHFGSFAPLSAVTGELSIECLISAIITISSQMYFVYQLHLVNCPSRMNLSMKALIVLLGTVGFAGQTGCVVMMFLRPGNIFVHRNMTFAVFAGISKGFSAAADVVATIAMCLFLSQASTGISRTSSLLRSLMHLVINRGVLVTAAQILLLVTFLATSGHLYWLAVHLNTTKLYVNTFFGMLNARTTLKDRYGTSGHISISNPDAGNTTFNSAARIADTKAAQCGNAECTVGCD